MEPGDRVETGDILAPADNIGASNASHLHFSIKPIYLGEEDWQWFNLEPSNGFHGAVDPAPYSTGVSAHTVRTARQKLQQFWPDIYEKYFLPNKGFGGIFKGQSLSAKEKIYVAGILQSSKDSSKVSLTIKGAAVFIPLVLILTGPLGLDSVTELQLTNLLDSVADTAVAALSVVSGIVTIWGHRPQVHSEQTGKRIM